MHTHKTFLFCSPLPHFVSFCVCGCKENLSLFIYLSCISFPLCLTVIYLSVLCLFIYTFIYNSFNNDDSNDKMIIKISHLTCSGINIFILIWKPTTTTTLQLSSSKTMPMYRLDYLIERERAEFLPPLIASAFVDGASVTLSCHMAYNHVTLIYLMQHRIHI